MYNNRSKTLQLLQVIVIFHIIFIALTVLGVPCKKKMKMEIPTTTEETTEAPFTTEETTETPPTVAETTGTPNKSGAAAFSAPINLKPKNVSCKICGEVYPELLKVDNNKYPEDPTFYPWLVGIYQYRVNEWMYSCMGSIISSWFVLTASHCFKRVDYLREEGNGYCKMKDGTTQLCFYTPDEIMFALTETQGEELHFHVQQIIIYPEYETNIRADIALVKLRRELVCTENAAPICLSPGDWVNFRPRPAILAGWGATATKKHYKSQRLKHTWLDVEDDSKCIGEGDQKNVLCTLGEAYNAASCHGDSGGPLIRFWNNTFYAIGVLAFGGTECTHHDDELFTRVTFYRKWIDKYVDLTGMIPFGTTSNITRVDFP